MVLEVFADPCTVNCRKVIAGLDLIGIDYDLKHIDYFTGQQKSDDFKKINPFATVPALRDGDLVLTESNAILQYAADLKSGSVYPTNLKQRADVNRWLLWEASAWFPSCYIYLVEYVVKPLLKAEPDQAVIDAQAPRFNAIASGLEMTLAKHRFVAGDDVTIADIAIASPMHLWKAQRLPLDKYPNILRWYGLIQQLPAWQKSQTAVDTALLPGGAESKQVRTRVNYSKETDKLTELYFYEHEKAASAHEAGDDNKEIVVHDGWDRANSFSVDKEGFSLLDFKTSYNAWEDDENVRKTFYPEIVELLKKELGAKDVLVFDHTIRTKANDAKKITQESNTSQRAPVKLVHCDYTAESAPVRVKQLLPDTADDLLKRRVAFINVWKPVRNRVEENPLAMCDVTSSPNSDFFKLYLRYRERTGENYVMKYSDQHKWYYFPLMETDKVILLKTYDSETDGRARFVGHTAFEDPTSLPNAATRESVEIRTIAFF